MDSDVLKEFKEMFIEFLCEHNILFQYNYNLAHHFFGIGGFVQNATMDNVFDYMRMHRKGLGERGAVHLQFIITYSFTWSKTPEGEDYWQELATVFHERFRKTDFFKKYQHEFIEY